MNAFTTVDSHRQLVPLQPLRPNSYEQKPLPKKQIVAIPTLAQNHPTQESSSDFICDIKTMIDAKFDKRPKKTKPATQNKGFETSRSV